jgi:putative restriction endonuclease
MLLRADIHKLFDSGYVAVDPTLIFHVSRALKEQYSNGRVYYELDGKPVRPPRDPAERPIAEFLEWHYSTVFRH